MSTFTAVCRRSGSWWAVSVPELKGVHTQVMRLDQAEEMSREAIALFLDVAPESVEIQVDVEVPSGGVSL